MRAILILSLLVGCAQMASSRRVSYEDAISEAAFDVATTLDLGQSNHAASLCLEGNAIIGACGQRVPPALYFATWMLLHAAISYVLPSGWLRSTWQGFTAGYETHAVVRNFAVGSRLSF